MAKTVTLGSANLLTLDSNGFRGGDISLTVTNLEGAQKIAFIYLKMAGVKTAQKRFLGVH